jgi:hypothetical protein
MRKKETSGAGIDQFKVVLQDIEPPIRRRFLVRDDESKTKEKP